jgi:hypothetical protein
LKRSIIARRYKGFCVVQAHTINNQPGNPDLPIELIIGAAMAAFQREHELEYGLSVTSCDPKTKAASQREPAFILNGCLVKLAEMA